MHSQPRWANIRAQIAVLQCRGRCVHCVVKQPTADNFGASTNQVSKRQLALLTAISILCISDLKAFASDRERIPLEEVKERLEKCFEEGQYYVSGALDRGIFAEDCVFTDPTIKVAGTLGLLMY
jgi:hypothetical protein